MSYARQASELLLGEDRVPARADALARWLRGSFLDKVVDLDRKTRGTPCAAERR